MIDPIAVEPLPQEFFWPSARKVAPRLLGHYLVRRLGNEVLAGLIVETEAYLVKDPACHAFGGLTARNCVMFGPAGVAYVYFIYGCHFCVNAVCCPDGVAEAVLIRAIEPALGVERMLINRPGSSRDLGNGPGKLCQALQITRELNGAVLSAPDSPLLIARNPEWAKYRRAQGPLRASPRIGITRAADLSLRFYLERSPFVSRRRS